MIFKKVPHYIKPYQVFQMLRYATSILIGIILVKGNYALSQIQFLETGTFYASLFSFFWISGILNIYLTNSKNDIDEASTIQTICLFGIVTSVIAIVLLYIIDIPVTQITVVVSFLFLNAVSYIIEYYFLKQNEHKKLLQNSLFFTSITLLPLAYMAWIQVDFKYLILWIIGISLIRFSSTFLLIPLKKSSFHFSFAKIKTIIIQSSPLSLAILLSGSGEYIDGILVKYFSGNTTFLIFRYGAKEFPITLLLANSLSVSMLPIIAKNSIEGISELKKRSSYLIWISAVFTIPALVFSHFIFSIFYSEFFKDSAVFFDIYILLTASRLVFPQTILNAHQENKNVLISSAVEIILNIILSISLFHLIGIYGILIGTVVCYAFDKAFLVYFCKKKLGIKPSDYIDIKSWLGYTILVLFLFILKYSVLQKILT